MRGAGRRGWLVAVAAASGCFAVLAACVGDDPGGAPVPPDAGSDGTSSTDTGTGTESGGGTDSGGDATPPRCNPNGAFTESEVTELNSPLSNGGARLSSDELTVYWHRAESDAMLPVITLWVAKRSTRDAVFGSLQPVVGLNKPAGKSDLFGALMPNGDLVFHSDRNDAGVGRDIWISHLQSGTFTAPEAFPQLSNPAYGERMPYPTKDGKEIFLTTDSLPDSGAVSPRVAVSQEIAAGSYGPAKAVELGGTVPELSPVLSADAKTIYFARTTQMFMSKRADRNSAWGPATPLTELNVVDSSSQPTWISDDGCVLWFFSNRPQNNPVSRIFVAKRAL